MKTNIKTKRLITILALVALLVSCVAVTASLLWKQPVFPQETASAKTVNVSTQEEFYQEVAENQIRDYVIQLNADIVLDHDYPYNYDIGNNFTIDLNGHLLMHQPDGRYGINMWFGVGEGVTFTIMDSQANSKNAYPHTIYNPVTERDNVFYGGVFVGCIDVYNGTFEFPSGTIAGNVDDWTMVNIPNGGTFNMGVDATICGNSSATVMYCKNGEVNMKGTIRDNYSTYCVADCGGKINFEGSVISGNVTDSRCIVAFNSAKVTISGAQIDNNETVESIIYVEGGSTVNMTKNSQLVNNKCVDVTIFMEGDTFFNVEDSIIQHNTINFKNDHDDGVFTLTDFSSKLGIKGTVVIADNHNEDGEDANIFIQCGDATIDILGKLGAGSHIGIGWYGSRNEDLWEYPLTNGFVEAGNGWIESQYFTTDIFASSDNYTAGLCGAEFYAVEPESRNAAKRAQITDYMASIQRVGLSVPLYFCSLSHVGNYLQDNDTIILNRNGALAHPVWIEKKNITLDLNSYVHTYYNWWNNNDCAIYIAEDKSFNLVDSSSGANNYITDPNSRTADSQVLVETGIFTGDIYAYGTFNFTSGAIAGTSPHNFVVCAEGSRAVFNMSGTALICYNRSYSTVWLSGCVSTISGGTITNNYGRCWADERFSGGIGLDGDSVLLNMSGDTVIYNNYGYTNEEEYEWRACDVNLWDHNSYITFVGMLGPNAKIGLAWDYEGRDVDYRLTRNYAAMGNGLAQTDQILIDDVHWHYGLAGTDLYVVWPENFTSIAVAALYRGGTGVPNYYSSFATIIADLKSGDYIQLVDDGVWDYELYIEVNNVTLDLNGHVLTYIGIKFHYWFEPGHYVWSGGYSHWIGDRHHYDYYYGINVTENVTFIITDGSVNASNTIIDPTTKEEVEIHSGVLNTNIRNMGKIKFNAGAIAGVLNEDQHIISTEHEKAEFHMSGTANFCHNAACVPITLDYGVMSITDNARITDNNCFDQWGVVCIGGDARFYVSGSPVIENNYYIEERIRYTYNLNLYDDTSKLVFDGKLQPDARIGITWNYGRRDISYALTQDFVTNNPDDAVALATNNIIIDDSYWKFGLNGTELYPVTPENFTSIAVAALYHENSTAPYYYSNFATVVHDLKENDRIVLVGEGIFDTPVHITRDNVTLDLNGQVLRYVGEIYYRYESGIIINSNLTFTITDSTGGHGSGSDYLHTFPDPQNSRNTVTIEGGVYIGNIWTYGVLNFINGTIGVTGSEEHRYYLVRVEDKFAQFNMSGNALICNNMTTDAMVYISSGTFTMADNATIRDNWTGYVVHFDGEKNTFGMSGYASITNNYSLDDTIYMYDVTFNMSFLANITKNKCERDTFNIDYSKMTMSESALVSENTAANVIIGVWEGTTFTMTDSATVSNNTAPNASVWVENGIFNMYGGYITGNTTTEEPWGAVVQHCLDDVINFKGLIVIADNYGSKREQNNLNFCNDDGGYVRIVGQLLPGSNIGVTWNFEGRDPTISFTDGFLVYSTYASAEELHTQALYFHSDNEYFDVGLNGDEIYPLEYCNDPEVIVAKIIREGVDTYYYTNFAAITNNMQDGDTIQLMNDGLFVTHVEIYWDNITLDLNGYMLTFDGYRNWGDAIYVDERLTFNLIDSAPISLTGHVVDDPIEHTQKVIYTGVYNGNFNMGGDAVLNFLSGTIAGYNYWDQVVIYICGDNGELNMTGTASICYNSSQTIIFAADRTVINITNGGIFNNYNEGGAIDSYGDTTINLSGMPIVYNNTSNIMLNDGGDVVTIVGELYEGTKIGIDTGGDAREFTSNFLKSGNEITASDYFIPDDSYFVVIIIGQELYMIDRDSYGEYVAQRIDDTDGVIGYYSNFFDAWYELETGETLRLVNDVLSLDDRLDFSVREATLDLNGHVLSFVEGVVYWHGRIWDFENPNGFAICVYQGYTLNITDSSVGVINTIYDPTQRKVVSVENGVFMGNIKVEGTLNFTGGTMAGCVDESNAGDAYTVFVQGGSASRRANFNMSGTAKISNGYVATPVYVSSNATFTMDGGTISNNKAGIGGVYVDNGTFTMNGGTIAENISYDGAGAVQLNDRGVFNLNGGTITGNLGSYYSGGIYVPVGTRLNIMGSPVVIGNTYGNSRRNIAVEEKLTQRINIVGELSPNASIGIYWNYMDYAFTSGFQTSGNGAVLASCFFNDYSDDYKAVLSNNELYFIESQDVVQITHNGTVKKYDDFDQAWAALQDGDVIQLLRDTFAYNALTVTHDNVIFDLYGYVLNMSEFTYGLTVPAGYTFTIQDSRAGSASNQISNPGTSSQTTINSGIYNGTIQINGGTLNFTGGTIAGVNNSKNYVVEIINSGAFNMSGSARITANKPAQYVVYLANGSMNMSGGTISGNISDGALYVGENGSITVSGNPTINSNKNASSGARNVFLPSDSSIIYVDGQLTGGEIGVYVLTYASRSIPVTIGFGANDNDESQIQYFVSDITQTCFGLQDSELYIGTHATSGICPHCGQCVNHVIITVVAQLANCNRVGWALHYKCNECGREYKDVAGTVAFTEEDYTPIDETLHSWGNTWTDNGDGYHVRKCLNGCSWISGTQTEQHTFNGTFYPDADNNGHYQICSANGCSAHTNPVLTHTWTISAVNWLSSVATNEVAYTLLDNIEVTIRCSICGATKIFNSPTSGATKDGKFVIDVNTIVDANCGIAGSANFKITVYCDGQELSSEKSYTINATGAHSYGDYYISSDASKHRRDCPVCGLYQETAHTFSGTWYSAGEDGHYQLCSAECGAQSTTSRHAYGAQYIEWTWADDASWVIATLTCSLCTVKEGASNAIEITVYREGEPTTTNSIVLSSKVASTCSKQGSETYKATVVVNGTPYVSSTYNHDKTISTPLDPSAHTWGGYVKIDDYTHKRTCINGCEQSEIVDHTWVVNAWNWPTKSYTNDTIGNIEDRIDSISVSLRCSVCSGTRTITSTANQECFTIVSNIKFATHTATGTANFTATVQIGEQAFATNGTSTRTYTLPVAGNHRYTGEWTYYTAALHIRYCDYGCGNYQTEAHNYVETWTDGGDEGHFHGCTSCTAKTTVAHTYNADSVIWDWALDGSSVTASFTCSVEECSHPLTVVVNKGAAGKNTITRISRQESTCMIAGSETYRAVIVLNNVTYTNDQTFTLDINNDNHKWGQWKTNGPSEHIATCEYNPEHTKTANHAWYVATATWATNGTIDDTNVDTVLQNLVISLVCSTCRENAEHTFDYEGDDEGNYKFVVVTNNIKPSGCTVGGNASFAVQIVYQDQTLSSTRSYTWGPNGNHSFTKWKADADGIHHSSTCDYGCGTTDKQEHSFGGDYVYTDTNATGHYQVCTAEGCNAHSTTVSHNYNGWETDPGAEATCTQSGTRHRECSTCHYVQNGTIPATGHVYEDNWETDRPATCTTAGSKYRDCTKCSDGRQEQVIPATGHNYELDTNNQGNGIEWINNESGIPQSVKLYLVCKQCSDGEERHALNKEIPVSNTLYISTTPSGDASCTTKGSIKYIIVIGEYEQGAEQDDNTTVNSAKLRTIFGNQITTADKISLEGNVTSSSDEMESDNPNGHRWVGSYNWVASAESASVVVTFTCSVCGDAKFIVETEHVTIRQTSSAPTCTESGKIRYTAVVNTSAITGNTETYTLVTQYDKFSTTTNVKDVENGGATGHSYTPDVYESNAEGHWQKCTKCGATTTSDEHINGYVDNGDGTHSLKCTICKWMDQGATAEKIPHSSDGTWHQDVENGKHYQVCEECGAKINYNEHNWVLKDTPDHKQHYKQCSVCAEEQAESRGDHHWTVYPEESGWAWGSSITNLKLTIRCEDCLATRILSNADFSVTQEGEQLDPTCTQVGHTVTYKVSTTYGDQTFESEHAYTLAMIPHSYTGAWEDAGEGKHQRECDYECGTFETDNHNFAGVWHNDGDLGHYRECADCGARSATTSHVWNGTDCTLCDATRSIDTAELDNAMQDALEKLRQAQQAAHDKIANRLASNALTSGDAATLDSLVDNEFNRASAAVNNAKTVEDVNKERDTGIGNMERIANTKGSTPSQPGNIELEKAKDEYKTKLEGYAETKKGDINQRLIEEDLSAEDAQKLRDFIDKELARGLNAIDNATTIDSIKDIEAASEENMDRIAATKGSTPDKPGDIELEQAKDECKTDLAKYAASKKDYIDERVRKNEISETEGEVLKSYIDKELVRGLNDINSATSATSAQLAEATSKSNMDRIASVKGEGNKLEQQKEEYRSDLEAYAKAMRQHIESRSDIDADTQATLKGLINSELVRGLNAINNAETAIDAYDAEVASKEVMKRLAYTVYGDDEGDGDLQLEKERDTYKTRLKEYAKQKQDYVDGRNNLTDGEKANLKNLIEQALVKGLDAIDKVTVKRDVKNIEQQYEAEMDRLAGLSGSNSPSTGTDTEIELELAKAKAIKALQAYAAQMKAHVDGRSELDANGKQLLNDRIDQVLSKAIADVNKANSVADIEGIETEAEDAMYEIAYTTKEDIDLSLDKDAAKEALRQAAIDAEARLQQRVDAEGLTDADRQTLVHLIKAELERAINNVEKATTKSAVETACYNGITNINSIAEIKRTSGTGDDKLVLAEKQEEFKSDLEEHAQGKKDAIDKRNDLTSTQKQTLKDLIDKELARGIENINNATTIAEAEAAQSTSKTNMDRIANATASGTGNTGSVELEERKEEYKADLEEHAQGKKNDIDERSDISSTQKDALKDLIDKELARGLANINNATTVDDALTAEKDSKANMDRIARATTGGTGGTGSIEVEQDKEEYKSALEDYAKEKKSYIDKRVGSGELTSAEGQILKDLIDKELAEGLGNINNATTVADAQKAEETSMSNMDRIADTLGKNNQGSNKNSGVEVEQKKAELKSDLKKYAEGKKKDIDTRNDLTLTQKQTLKDLIDNELERGLAKINNATTVDEAQKTQAESKSYMDRIARATTNGTGGTGSIDLEQKKDESMSDLEDHAQQKKDDIDARYDLDEDEKETLKDLIDKELSKALEDINNATTVADVTAIHDASIDEMDQIASAEGRRNQGGNPNSGVQVVEAKKKLTSDLDAYAQGRKSYIDQRVRNGELTSAEGQTLKDLIDEELKDGLANINKATTVADAEVAQSVSKSAMDEIANAESSKKQGSKPSSGVEIVEAKRQFKRNLQEYASERKEYVDQRVARGELTASEGEILKGLIDEELARGLENIGKTTTIEDAEAAQDASKEVMNRLADTEGRRDQGNKPNSGVVVEQNKSRFKSALEEYAKAKKDYIDQRVKKGELTSAEGENLKQLIDNELERGLKAIDDTDTVADAEAAQDASKSVMDRIAEAKGSKGVGTGGTIELEKAKDKYKSDLEEYAKKKKAYVTARTDLYDDEKETLKRMIDEELASALKKIDEAGLTLDVEDIEIASRDEMDRIAELSGRRGVTSGKPSEIEMETARKNAQQALEDAVQKAKERVATRVRKGELTASEGETLNDLIDKELARAQKAVDDAETVGEIQDARDDGIDTFERLAEAKGKKGTGSGDTIELEQKRSQAKSELEEAADNAKKDIDKRVKKGEITEQDGNKLKDRIDEALEEALENIGDADTVAEVDDAVSKTKSKFGRIAQSDPNNEDEELDLEKEDALDQLEKAADNAKSEVDARDDLTDEQKTTLKDLIDHEKERAQEGIENADTLEEIQEELKKGLEWVAKVKKIDASGIGSITDKDRAKQELEQAAKKAQQEIGDRNDLTDEEKEVLGDLVYQEKRLAQSAIDEAETDDQVLSELNKGINAMDLIAKLSGANKDLDIGWSIVSLVLQAIILVVAIVAVKKKQQKRKKQNRA